jgi:hypothetical protein
MIQFDPQQSPFDAATHRYCLDGVPMPSVTRILEHAGLVDYTFLGERRKEYLERGRAVHLATQCYDEGNLAEASMPLELRGFLDAWRLFRNDYAFQPILIEHKVFHAEHQYAGTLDRTGHIRGGTEILLDIKSGLVPPAVRYQLAAYAACLPHPRTRLRRCVELHEDGSYRVIGFETSDYQRDFHEFLGALEKFRAREEEKMTPARDLETRALTLAEQASALEVTDQPSYELAAERLLAVADLRREIVAHHEPIKRAAHTAWQQVLAAEKRLLDPVADAERIYKAGIASYEAEQRRIEAEARAKAETEARRLAEEQREREIEQAEAEGADLAEVTAMIAAPLPAIRPQSQPMFQSARGISTATNWKGEVVSLEKLVAAVAAGRANIALVMANETAINQLARATRGTLEVPGIRFFSQSTVRAGRR